MRAVTIGVASPQIEIQLRGDLQLDVLGTTCNAKDPGPGPEDGVTMPGEPEPVPREQDPARLVPGDLLTFSNRGGPVTHVGLYIGGGRMIHAPSENDVIREMAVFTGYWGAHYTGAGRVRGQ